MPKLRLLFTKTERAVYISHLDLMRTLQRAFRRAGLDLRHSEGFNPHPIMSILMPLSLGQSSQCELMDFELAGEVPIDTIPERLNAVLPEGIKALKVDEAQRKVKEIKWLRVRGRLEYDSKDPTAVIPALESFFAKKELIITRKTKRGEGESDIAPAIRSIAFQAENDFVRMEAVISAQEPTLNPEHLISALRQLQPELAPDFAAFHRLAFYEADGKEFM